MGTDSCGSKETYGGQDRTNPFAAAMGDKMAIRPFVKNLLTTCLILVVFCYFVVLVRAVDQAG